MIMSHNNKLLLKVNEKENKNYDILIEKICDEIVTHNSDCAVDINNNYSNLKTLIIKLISKFSSTYNPSSPHEEIIASVFNILFGYGPLQPYIDDEEVSDIDGTSCSNFTIIKNGIKEIINVSFKSEDAFIKYCKTVATRFSSNLNNSDSYCRISDYDNRLRISLCIPPRNLVSASISIRSHRKHSYTLKDLLDLNMFDVNIYEFLNSLSSSKINVLVAGVGGSGKTTLLRAIVNKMPLLDRVLICESVPEIYPDKINCISQKISDDFEGGKSVTLADLIKVGLTLSLDTYVIGESKEGEVWDLIGAGHSGHRVLTTTHSINAYESLNRLLFLSKMSNNSIDEKLLKQMIASVFNIIIFVEGFKVKSIVEVSTTPDNYTYNELFQYDELFKVVNEPSLKLKKLMERKEI